MLTRFGRIILDLLRWWRGELWALVPTAVRRRLFPPKPQVQIAWEGDGPRLEVWRRDVRLFASDSELTAADLYERASAAAGAPLTPRDCIEVLRLPPSVALRRAVTLPRAAEANLRQAVGFLVPEISPFRREEAYHAAGLVRRRDDGKSIDVDVVVAKRDAVDDHIERAAALGFQPVVVTDSIECGRADGALNLLPQLSDGGAGRRRRFVRLALAGCAATLAAASLYLPYRAGEARIRSLQAEIDMLKPQIEEARALRDRVAALRGTYDQAREVLSGSVPQLDILLRLTKILTDETWLNAYRSDGRTVTIGGDSRNASSIPSQIDSAPLFDRARFTSPLAGTQANGTQSFQLTFDLGAR